MTLRKNLWQLPQHYCAVKNISHVKNSTKTEIGPTIGLAVVLSNNKKLAKMLKVSHPSVINVIPAQTDKLV